MIVWAHLNFSGFLPQSIMNVRLIGDSKLVVGVDMSVRFTLEGTAIINEQSTY